MRRPAGRRQARGAVLVESALILPVLILILFAVIEFGYAFLQYLDVRHAARETGRLAAVNFAPTANAIIDEGCTRIDQSDGVTMTLTLLEPNGNTGDGSVGDTVRVDVTRTYSSLTGFFSFLDITMDSHVEVRMEQDADFASGTRACP